MNQEGEQRERQESERKEQNRNPFIDTKCAGEKYLRIKGRSIIYTGDWDYTQLLSSLPISTRNTASIRLVNVHDGAIGLGVIDSKLRD